MTAIEFEGWPRTPRLFGSDATITEKIDGTNAAVIIAPASEVEWTDADRFVTNPADGETYVIAAQSRKRLIVPGDDNYGFAAWVWENAEALVQFLGAGRHFGEWWGKGIQRKYGMDHKVFSLFNTSRYAHFVDDPAIDDAVPSLAVVPVLYEGPFSETPIHDALSDLQEYGSAAAEGFENPEGVCIYHHQANRVFKVTYDDRPKGLVLAETGLL